ncbi:hypothetical protein GCM10007973_28460 [Polymorphobacter multimanifer]|uniref:Putative membrane protein n=1 Tax=Polymorphobacter multimanifer TaxID=1070431 RepID=A0A841LCI1_9SPHN|nr:SdpI family protein [Polymorphobacter multimanifer]MBB6229421.1 putative membrane protein [Polymorphobacter multimanifer]GGI90471.1 hypothetical protein GCM10007973_28460 [Polymorphobacter multimanifer]
MHSRSLVIISALVVGLLAAIAMIALLKLPADAQLPVHWSAAGKADRFAEAWLALFVPVAIAAGLSGLLAILPYIEPLQDRMAGSASLLATAWVGLLAMMVMTQVAVSAPAFSVHVPLTLHLAGLGVLMVASGNALPKSRPGFFVGIRTPWTLTDTDNWIATHRLGSRTMIAGGMLIMVASVVPMTPDSRGSLVMLALPVAVVPPIVFSWWFWRRKEGATWN